MSEKAIRLFRPMRRNKSLKFVILSVTIICFAIYILSIKDQREKILRNRGIEIVNLIKLYKIENSKLPNSLNDLGIEESEEGPVFYVKLDSLNYIVYYGTSLGESIIFYSDINSWVDRARRMKLDQEQKSVP